jgi:hypothetical protein
MSDAESTSSSQSETSKFFSRYLRTPPRRPSDGVKAKPTRKPLADEVKQNLNPKVTTPKKSEKPIASLLKQGRRLDFDHRNPRNQAEKSYAKESLVSSITNQVQILMREFPDAKELATLQQILK